jgi:SRSO17 transposase
MMPDETPMFGSVEEYGPITMEVVNKTRLEALWDDLIRKHHYLGFGKMIGQNVKYLAMASGRPVAALSYNRASLRVWARDVYIGWTDEERRRDLGRVVCNNRFLVMPWARIKNLASHVLALSLRAIRRDWKERHGQAPGLAETFIDGARFKGTSYLAANWKRVGETLGYGKRGKAFEYHGETKGVFVYELEKGFAKGAIPPPRWPPRPRKPDQGEEKIKMLAQVIDWNMKLLEAAGVTEENISETKALLLTYLAMFDDCASHVAQKKYMIQYVIGLLSDLQRKTVEGIALLNGGDSSEVRGFQYYMRSGAFSNGDLQDRYEEVLSGKMATPRGALVIDGCDLPKKGLESVGVARQHCGRLGKTDNCQASVVMGYVGEDGVYSPVRARLYVPEKWFGDEYAERRDRCGLTDEVVFRTKNEIATEMLRTAVDGGLFPAEVVLVDSAFGHDRKFLDAVPTGMIYYADVHCDDRFYAAMPEVGVPGWSGRGRRPSRPVAGEKPIAVARIVEESEVPWTETVFGLGSKGPIVGHEKLLRVIDVRDGLPRDQVWLHARRLADGSVKYSVSDAPEDTAPEKFREYALKRWPIEQCFEECKSELGMDHYEGRSWIGWHRHILLVFIAHLFLHILRMKYSADKEDLSEIGQKVCEATRKDTGSKIMILTLAAARDLAKSALAGSIYTIKQAIGKVNYSMKSYAAAFWHHIKNIPDKYKCLASYLDLF